ncbi:MAG: GAF domain-containing protein [Paracoccaceae bacterium]
MNPDAVFSALHAEARELVGARLFTTTVLDRKRGLARRAYTSHPVEYPVSGTKPMRHDAWTDLVLGEGRSFVANTTPEFAIFFSDHALINSLGCQSAMNIPVPDDAGLVVGTVNILDAEGHFTPDRVAALEALVARRRGDLLTALALVPMEP